MNGEIDLYTLTEYQLVSLVQVLTQAITFGTKADERLFEKIETNDIQEGDFEKFIQAKAEILQGLMASQEQIIGGVGDGALN